MLPRVPGLPCSGSFDVKYVYIVEINETTSMITGADKGRPNWEAYVGMTVLPRGAYHPPTTTTTTTKGCREFTA